MKIIHIPVTFAYFKAKNKEVQSKKKRLFLYLDGSDTTTFCILYGKLLVGSLGHARLTAIKSAFGLDILLVYTP